MTPEEANARFMYAVDLLISDLECVKYAPKDEPLNLTDYQKESIILAMEKAVARARAAREARRKPYSARQRALGSLPLL